MRNKIDREKLEGLLAEIHTDNYENGSAGEVCLSPMLGETVDPENNWTSEGEDNDEHFS